MHSDKHHCTHSERGYPNVCVSDRVSIYARMIWLMRVTESENECESGQRHLVEIIIPPAMALDAPVHHLSTLANRSNGSAPRPVEKAVSQPYHHTVTVGQLQVHSSCADTAVMQTMQAAATCSQDCRMGVWSIASVVFLGTFRVSVCFVSSSAVDPEMHMLLFSFRPSGVLVGVTKGSRN